MQSMRCHTAYPRAYVTQRKAVRLLVSSRNVLVPDASVFLPRVGHSLPRQRQLRLRPSAIAAPELGSPNAITGTAAGDPGRYQNSDWASAFTTQFKEYDYWVTEVEGSVPETLRGTLFRNGPGRFERGDQKYEHMLDGDGYVCSFSFNGKGKMHFRSAYVRTSELEKEAEANAVLYRNTFGTQPKKPLGPMQNAFDLTLKNPANTNVVLWGNRLLALWEAGCPFELNPHTLETYPGPETLGGFLRKGIAPSTTGAEFLDKAIGLGKACTAHPHVVHGQGTSDRLAMFSWQRGTDGAGMTKGQSCFTHAAILSKVTLAMASWQSQLKPLSGSEMTIDIGEFDEDWQKVAGQSFTMQKSFFNPHDFAISENHYVFFQNAMSFKMGAYLLGLKGPAQCVKFDDGPMKIHLVPRNGDKPMVIDGVEPSFLIHHANAFEDGDEIVVWSSGWSPEAVQILASSPGSGMLGSWKVVMDGDFNDVPVSSLWSHRINRKTGEVTRHCLFAQSNDHPRVNPSFYSRPTRFVYVNMCMAEDTDPASSAAETSQDCDAQPAKASAPAAREYSNIVPAPAFLGRSQQSIPDAAATPVTASAGLSWTTEDAASSCSLMPGVVPISPRMSLHAYAIRDTTPYTEVPLPVGGVPLQPTSLWEQSVRTAKDRLKNLGQLGSYSGLLSFGRDQPDQTVSQASTDGDSCRLPIFGSIESSMEEDAFPASASKVPSNFFKKAGSTRDMESLEWLNLCSGPPKAFTRVDTHTGEAQTWFPGRRCFCEELVFVPGPNAASEEEDGYLLGLVYDAAKHRSFLSILDAADFSKGPVAKLWLKHHVPHGLHGFFSPQYYGPCD